MKIMMMMKLKFEVKILMKNKMKLNQSHDAKK